jgi:hypothetical protein
MEMPKELADLAAMLDEGKLALLRERVSERRMLKTPLSRFTDRIFFFPFGIQPNLKAPIQVWVNGITMAEDMDFVVRVVGSKIRLTVVVFQNPLTDLCNSQALYENIPPSD